MDCPVSTVSSVRQKEDLERQMQRLKATRSRKKPWKLLLALMTSAQKLEKLLADTSIGTIVVENVIV